MRALRIIWKHTYYYYYYYYYQRKVIVTHRRVCCGRRGGQHAGMIPLINRPSLTERVAAAGIAAFGVFCSTLPAPEKRPTRVDIRIPPEIEIVLVKDTARSSPTIVIDRSKVDLNDS